MRDKLVGATVETVLAGRIWLSMSNAGAASVTGSCW